jgi:glycosyltransferase involved in cell wall biosynthesis
MLNKKKPLISIIINCYNGERYLKNSIQSVLNQSYNNWELIFWDNKSTDSSKKIALSYKDKRVKYFFSKKFTGLYQARNLAIRKAKGEFICFLDTDDWWVKNKLLEQVKLIKKKNDISFIYSNFYIYNQKKKIKLLRSIKKLPSGKITQHLLNNYQIGILTVMIKKKYFNKKKFNKKYSIIGDFDYFINLSIKNKMYYHDKPLAYYRIHQKNFSNNHNIYINEWSRWLTDNSRKFKKLGYSLNQIYINMFKLKVKKFLRLGS